MYWNWLPWKFIVRRLARSHGFLDPLEIYGRLRRFAQPSEVGEPIELLRAGAVFHARGLMNTKAIQHNLDWVWPYWIERQFNPRDGAFVPRAFSLSHINLTHRNWTAVGLPDCRALPLVDPRGLLTPFFDGWSLDCWLQGPDGQWLFPSKTDEVTQELQLPDSGPVVHTKVDGDDLHLELDATVLLVDNRPVCRLTAHGRGPTGGRLIVSLRPANPEGVSFVHELDVGGDGRSWRVNDCPGPQFAETPSVVRASDYANGDVRIRLEENHSADVFSDAVGMLTAAAVFPLDDQGERRIGVDVDLEADEQSTPVFPAAQPHPDWAHARNGLCELVVPDEHMSFLWKAHIHGLLLHAPEDVYPGPYTYRRFWFRDAALILNAMLAVGMHDRARRQLDCFPERQQRDGYFRSQDGEWDSNGQALWIMDRYARLTGRGVPPAWIESIVSGARWIVDKRLDADSEDWQAGLLPAGFSAEHLGTNDYYYWDDFWGVAGLEAAARMVAGHNGNDDARWQHEADSLRAAIDRSITRSRVERGRQGVPASPYRRMDSGAIGNMAVTYPLQLWAPDDPRLRETVEFLLGNCLVHGAFFQDMIHSGLNAYLTLHIAQALLRDGDDRYWPLVRRVAELASPTGQWPEAIHPNTLGGCMGDGEHIWAAAEWLLMMRALFVREEGDRLVLGSGLPTEWLDSGEELRLGPAATLFGPITVQIRHTDGRAHLSWEAEWHTPPAGIDVAVPGCAHFEAEADEQGEIALRPA